MEIWEYVNSKACVAAAAMATISCCKQNAEKEEMGDENAKQNIKQ